MARIVTVNKRKKGNLELTDMSYIRWFKISEALARLGHEVDIATQEDVLQQRPVSMGHNLRRVHLADIRWETYDVVKTLFNAGFDTLSHYGGLGHPHIIAKLGSVVDKEDRAGVYFYGDIRKRLYENQEQVSRYSKYVTVLTEESRNLWISCFGREEKLLLVPGAADGEIPKRKQDPFPAGTEKRCLFAGHLYDASSQPEAHQVLSDHLNSLGRLLSRRNVRLYVMGPGDTQSVNPEWVTHLGPIPYEEAWQYFYAAHVGIVLALGSEPNHNESTKIYHYLRAGLPIVCESYFPNQNIIRETNLGFISENGDMEHMADLIEEAMSRDWDKESAIRYILDHHTWDKRAEIYDRIIQRDLNREKSRRPLAPAETYSGNWKV